MPTQQHEGVTKLPTLDFGHAAQMLRTLLDLRIPDSGEARLASPDMSDAIPAVCRADAALLYGKDKEKFGVITETQRGRDDDKLYSWLEYIANFRAREKCPVCLVVICPNLATARWAEKPITTGHPGLTLTPLVIGPHNTPFITDVNEALSNIGLAVVAAVTKNDDPRVKEVLGTLSEALNKLESGLGARYARYVYVSLTGVAQKEWGRLMAMMTYPYQGEFAESLQAKGEIKLLMMLLESRGIGLSDEVRELITTCEDTATIEAWFQRALTATSEEDLFD
ncbi:hypothetical protein [Nonomuraea jiangxiensis]|uniref:Uncharacterized protein n=1 Tax=Nonomuraea jiangxiensis TaxID=633440 RepID=A0A1G9SF15_9ACTN|nr:hypothetical protein [Nonomuraea jiangxiensis]SDM34074.1 hypothetical protein SAMN05421869_14142 [Nonomuraea jiangxiensis]